MLRPIVIGVVALIGWAPAQGSEPAAGYELTIRNTNPGQNFSPPVILLHTPEYRLFEPGQPASTPLWRLAEDGSTSEFQALDHPTVRRVVVGEPVHRRTSPVVTVELAVPSDLLISVAAMLSLTNDGFVAARSVGLPEDVGASTTVALLAYDAGSEANTESCAHVPCEVHDVRMTAGAEGRVMRHAGIRGDADIAPSRGWQGSELGTLTITRFR